MDARDVIDLLKVLEADGVEPILDGGWGIDALLGSQHRDHGDVDMVVPLADLDTVLESLASVGFAVTIDLRPTRVEATDGAGRKVDLHPVRIDDAGDLWQAGAGPDGSDASYPAAEITTGWVGGRQVRCISALLQVRHHSGYEPTARDLKDLTLLQRQFGVSLPEGYY